MTNAAAVRDYTYVIEDEIRMLVVDDDPIQREFAGVYLSTPATTIDSAESAETALGRLKSGVFDIVLVDYDMPGMNGIALIRAIRADPQLADLPVIMVTSREDVASIDEAFVEGATSFVTKPVNWRLLSYQVRYVLRAHKLMISNQDASLD